MHTQIVQQGCVLYTLSKSCDAFPNQHFLSLQLCRYYRYFHYSMYIFGTPAVFAITTNKYLWHFLSPTSGLSSRLSLRVAQMVLAARGKVWSSQVPQLTWKKQVGWGTRLGLEQTFGGKRNFVACMAYASLHSKLDLAHKRLFFYIYKGRGVKPVYKNHFYFSFLFFEHCQMLKKAFDNIQIREMKSESSFILAND